MKRTRARGRDACCYCLPWASASLTAPWSLPHASTLGCPSLCPCPPATRLFFSASFLACTHTDSTAVQGHTHALGCISEVSHLDISPFPARPGTQREANPALAYLPSAPGLNRGQQPCVGSRGCESAERCQCQGCMLRLSAAPAASPPPAPRCCVAMRSHPREEQHLCPQQEVPLAPHAGGEQGRPRDPWSSLGDRPQGEEGEEWRCKGRHERGRRRQNTHGERRWGGKEKGGGVYFH